MPPFRPHSSSGPALPVRHLVRHRPGDGGSVSHSPSSLLPSPGRACARAFTIVEVMMASVILVVGLIGMIQGITIGSEMMATARRQTIAAQILDHEIGKLRLLPWDVTTAAPNELCINDLPATLAAATYDSDLASLDTAIAASGVTFTLARTVTTVTTDLREVTFTVTWTKSGTTTAATTATGSWFEQLSFASPSPIARTYTRKSTAYFGKYGLNTRQ